MAKPLKGLNNLFLIENKTLSSDGSHSCSDDDSEIDLEFEIESSSSSGESVDFQNQAPQSLPAQNDFISLQGLHFPSPDLANMERVSGRTRILGLQISDESYVSYVPRR